MDAVDDRLQHDVRAHECGTDDARDRDAQNGRIALKTCVTVRTPRSNAAFASAAVASLWPSETAMPRACSRSTSSSAPGKLRRQRHEPRPGRPRAGARASSRSGSRRLAAGCVPSRRAEMNGPFEMRAEDARASGPCGDGAQRRDEIVLLGRRDERRQVRGHAGLEQRVAGAVVPCAIRAEKVDAGEPVHLEVDEARHGDPWPPPPSPTSVTSPPSRATSPGTSRPSTSAASTPSRTQRPAPCARRRATASSRARAPSASTPASSETIATLASPPAASSAASTSVRAGAGRVRDDPPHPRAQLCVRRDDVDHQVPEGLPEPHHRDRGDHVEHELLRRAGLEPRRAGDHLGPDDDRDLVLGEPADLGVVDRHERDRERSGPPGLATSAPTTYGVLPLALNPTTASSGPTPSSADLAATFVLVVLCVLLRRRRARRAACDQRHDEPGRNGERRLALGRIDEREPARRSGPDVDEPAACLEPLGDRVDRRRDRALRPRRPPPAPTRPRCSSARRAPPSTAGRGRPPPGSTPRWRARRASRRRASAGRAARHVASVCTMW